MSTESAGTPIPEVTLAVPTEQARSRVIAAECGPHQAPDRRTAAHHDRSHHGARLLGLARSWWLVLATSDRGHAWRPAGPMPSTTTSTVNID